MLNYNKTAQKIVGTATAGVVLYYAYKKYTSKEAGSDDETCADSDESQSDFFWCPREFYFDVVPKLLEQLPDPTDEGFAPPRIVQMEYAVRGLIPSVAAQMEEELRGGKTFPFKKLLYCNIGNPIAVGHQPYTYIRQMLGAYWNKDTSNIPVELAEELKSWTENHQAGAYTNHRGSAGFIKAVVKFLDRRDATVNADFTVKARNTQVFLCDGASGGITVLMELLMDTMAHEKNFQYHNDGSYQSEFETVQKNIEKFKGAARNPKYSANSGIFCPIPQYPLYSATIRRLGGTIIPYELEEEQEWALPPIAVLEHLYAESVANGVFPRAFVVINPGNPSGNVLSRQDLVNILRFCHRYRLVVLADEVYQDNVWHDTKKYYPLRRILFEENIGCKVASFHSCSKGFSGECGVRGGFMALDNFPKHIVALIDKLCSVRLCPNVGGQVAIAAVCTPPMGDSDCAQQYQSERSKVQETMKSKALMLVSKLNELEGVTCNPAAGAMYAYPQIRLPKRAIAEAKKQGIAPDTLYCLDLLNSTGIVTVPGSGFKQKVGTYHYRITILPSEDSLRDALQRMSKFHSTWLDKYRD